MDYYFLLISADDDRNGKNGLKYVMDNKTKWIKCNEAVEFLTTGYSKGVDFIIKDGKAAMVKKSYINIDEKYVVHLCVESLAGSDQI